MTAAAAEVSPDWREVLAWVREQRTVPLPTLVRTWDARWRRWFDIYLGRGGTPNGAFSFAYRKTIDQLGPRPGPYPDGSNAQEDS